MGVRGIRAVGVALVACLATGATPARVHAQAANEAPARPTLSIALPADTLLAQRGPTVQATHMLMGERIRELLLAGFPARFHFRVELWTEGRFFFDHLERATEFDMYARYLPVERTYEVLQVQDDRAMSLGRYVDVADAERALARPILAPIVAPRIGATMYYQASLVVEALSARDLDEVSRWLQGDVEPGITGKANPASIVSRGLRTLASRLLGGEKLEYESTTDRFRVR